jgi:hypothetical protein
VTDFITQPAFEIGRRLEIRGSYAWFVVLRPAEDEDALANFVADLSAVLERPLRIVASADSSIEKLHNDLSETWAEPVLMADLDQADPERWSALDVNRSALSREGAIVLWLSAAGVANLCSYAPNLRSFVGGSIFNLGTDGGAMTTAERNQRIADLESHFAMTSADVVKLAKSGSLPTEPHFVEWLVLLGRGDLV